MRINPYYLSLIQQVGDPIFKQAVPDPVEMMDFTGVPDPLHEEEGADADTLAGVDQRLGERLGAGHDHRGGEREHGADHHAAAAVGQLAEEPGGAHEMGLLGR